MPKRPQVMTEERLIAAGHHMAESREQFVKELHRTMDAFVSFNERLRAFEEFLDNRDELIMKRMELHHSVLDALLAVQKVLTENTAALTENSDRLGQFLTKFEMYFGTEHGLELEN